MTESEGIILFFHDLLAQVSCQWVILSNINPFDLFVAFALIAIDPRLFFFFCMPPAVTYAACLTFPLEFCLLNPISCWTISFFCYSFFFLSVYSIFFVTVCAQSQPMISWNLLQLNRSSLSLTLSLYFFQICQEDNTLLSQRVQQLHSSNPKQINHVEKKEVIFGK